LYLFQRTIAYDLRSDVDEEVTEAKFFGTTGYCLAIASGGAKAETPLTSTAVAATTKLRRNIICFFVVG
jgi:hypothetical protein